MNLETYDPHAKMPKRSRQFWQFVGLSFLIPAATTGFALTIDGGEQVLAATQLSSKANAAAVVHEVNNMLKPALYDEALILSCLGVLELGYVAVTELLVSRSTGSATKQPQLPTTSLRQTLEQNPIRITVPTSPID